eukprot:TRINITY_DN4121_c0_g1_i1.p1 TRINITY_DN4121_c0_g1~~TRINITY_DN4121_c0_g1_i1.p1  ORF type:complete len:688 (+),score=-101.55 TRINITY_DN4121_c0_g1_i1:305-2368(+)
MPSQPSALAVENFLNSSTESTESLVTKETFLNTTEAKALKDFLLKAMPFATGSETVFQEHALVKTAHKIFDYLANELSTDNPTAFAPWKSSFLKEFKKLVGNATRKYTEIHGSEVGEKQILNLNKLALLLEAEVEKTEKTSVIDLYLVDDSNKEAGRLKALLAAITALRNERSTPYITKSTLLTLLKEKKITDETLQWFSENILLSATTKEEQEKTREQRKKNKDLIFKGALAISAIVALGEGLVGFAFALSASLSLPVVIFIGAAATFSNFYLFNKSCVEILKDIYSGKLLKNPDGTSLSLRAKIFSVGMLTFCAGTAAALGFLALDSGFTAFSLFITNPIAAYAVAGVIAGITTIALFTLFAHIVVSWLRNGSFNGLAKWYDETYPQKIVPGGTPLSLQQKVHFFLRLPFQALHDLLQHGWQQIVQWLAKEKHEAKYDERHALRSKAAFWGITTLKAARHFAYYALVIGGSVVINTTVSGLFWAQSVHILSRLGVALSAAQQASAAIVGLGFLLNAIFYTQALQNFFKVVYPERLGNFLAHERTVYKAANNPVCKAHHCNTVALRTALFILAAINGSSQYLGALTNQTASYLVSGLFGFIPSPETAHYIAAVAAGAGSYGAVSHSMNEANPLVPTIAEDKATSFSFFSLPRLDFLGKMAEEEEEKAKIEELDNVEKNPLLGTTNS